MHTIIFSKIEKELTIEGTTHKVFSNLINQDFKADEINTKWCTDFTYLFLTDGSKRYNCTIIELYDCSVVASIIDKHITSDLAIRTVTKAFECQPTAKNGLILHSDQGSQYTSKNYLNISFNPFSISLVIVKFCSLIYSLNKSFHKEEIERKYGKRKNSEFAEIVGIETVTLSYICNGKRALTKERAEEFGSILGVRPEYLLGKDDFRTYDKRWLIHSTSVDIKKQLFLEHCMTFWGYKIVGNSNVYDDQNNVINIIFKIKKPSNEIVDITGDKIASLENEILDFVRYKLENI